MFFASRKRRSLNVVEVAEYAVAFTVAVATVIGLLRVIGLLG